MEIPKRKRALQMGEGRSAHADFRAFGLNQAWNFRGRRAWVGIVRRDWFRGLRRATPVIAVKTESALYIELSLGPRAEHQTRFWFGQELGGRAGIGGRKVDHRSAR